MKFPNADLLCKYLFKAIGHKQKACYLSFTKEAQVWGMLIHSCSMHTDGKCKSY